MFERESSMERQWMVVDGRDETESYEEQMLIYNCPEGLLPLDIIVRSGVRRYRYDISGAQSVAELAVEKKLSGEMIRLLFEGIHSTVIQGRRYLLREENYCITPQSVFADRNWQIYLCYLPGYNRKITEQLTDLSEWVLEHLDPLDSLAVYRGYSIHVLCKEGKVGLSDLQRLFTPEEEYKNPEIALPLQAEPDEVSIESGAVATYNQAKGKHLLSNGVWLLFLEGGMVFALFCAIVFLLP